MLAVICFLVVRSIKRTSECREEVEVRWIGAGDGANSVCWSPDGSALFVGYGLDKDPSPIKAFDLLSGSWLRTIPFQEAFTCHMGIAITNDSRYLCTTHCYHRYISRIDLLENNKRQDLVISTADGVEDAWAVYLGVMPDQQKLVVPLGNDGRVVDEENDQVSIVDIA